MPGAVPGVPPQSPTGHTAPVAQQMQPQAPNPQAGLMDAMGLSAMIPPDPSQMRYHTETQSDGSVLLRVLNPDGSAGPVVQVIPPPKRAIPGGGGKK